MSEFRVEKRRVAAELTLSAGRRVKGCFFLAAASPTRPGPERVSDMLNAADGFFPFELHSESGEPAQVVLYNRAHLAVVYLSEPDLEPDHDESYQAAPRKSAAMRMSTGEELTGVVHVFRPAGRDRLSDYAKVDERFRYLETSAHTLIVNFDEVVEIVPIAE